MRVYFSLFLLLVGTACQRGEGLRIHSRGSSEGAPVPTAGSSSQTESVGSAPVSMVPAPGAEGPRTVMPLPPVVAVPPAPPQPAPARPVAPAAPNLTSKEARFLDTLYRDLLGRPLDQSGFDHWLPKLQDGSRVYRLSVVGAILRTVEYRKVLIQSYFQRYLARAAEEAGLIYFINLLDGGSTPAEIRALITSSDEYVARAKVRFPAGNDHQSWMAALYKDLLGRSRAVDGSDGARAKLALPEDIRHRIASQLIATDEARLKLIEEWSLKYLGRRLERAETGEDDDDDDGEDELSVALRQIENRGEEFLQRRLLSSGEYFD